MSENLVSIVIPTYNESKNIEPLLESISRNVLRKSQTETIVVDDNSPDGTSSIVENYIQTNPLHNHSISLITRKNERGLSSAILKGIENSKGDIVVVMDSDFSHPPEVIPKMIDTLEHTTYDIVVASRHISQGAIKGWSTKRKLISKIATKIARYGLGIKIKDPMSGFFAFRKNLLNNLKFDAIGYKMLLEILVKTRNASVKEIPYTFIDRQLGSSKLGASTMLDYCKAVWKLYRYGKTQQKNEPRTSVRFISKAIRFFTVGASGLLVNYLTSILFLSAADFWYIHATIIGIMVSITTNFGLNKYWTFEDRDFSPKRTLIQYGKFSTFSSIGALMQLGMVYYLVDMNDLPYSLSLVLAVGIGALSNFIFNKKWTFKEKIWS